MPNESERLIAEWTDRPYTGVRKRHIVVEHRIVAIWYPDVGCDLRHDIRCEDRDIETWSAAETWELRNYGIDKVTTDIGRGLP